MSLDIVENVFMLLAAILGLLYSVFKYIETPKRGWLYLSVFFLSHLLSDYYWTTYTLVMRTDPDVSGLMAYFGWNTGYIFLMLLALYMRRPGTKGYFHVLMLLPIPLNIALFFLYIQFGGLFNNLWEGVLLTVTAVLCVRSIIFYLKNKDDKAAFPWIHLTILAFIFTEYGMWTSSCFFWDSNMRNPYYYFAFANMIVLILMPWAMMKETGAAEDADHGKDTADLRLQLILQIIVSAIVFLGCVSGYYFAGWMRNRLPDEGVDTGIYGLIAIMLFIISVFVVILVLAVIFIATIRYRSHNRESGSTEGIKRVRYNFISVVLVSLALMVFSVTYTSRLFYRVSVTGIMESGQDKAETLSTDLENYLGSARSVLQVTADTVDLMIHNGQPLENINLYIVGQTKNQAHHFDENFTGLYAYIDGVYIDGLEWVPPEGYNAETRDWYKAAVDAGGKTTIISPYVDAQTGSVVITFAKLLEDGKEKGSYDKRNVVALDMIVNHINEVTEEVNIGGKGFGMVVNSDGLIVAHKEGEYSGDNIKDIYGEELLKDILDQGSGALKTEVLYEKSTLFVSPVLNQWYVVIAVSDSELLEEAQLQLLVNIVVSLIIFMLISFFYYLGYRNEQVYSRKMEEMSISRQKQEYEAQVLKLEKLAADEANKAKSGFLADMSHEIRTPINAILGMNEMILRESSDKNILEYAGNVRASGRNLLQLINSILDFSKIEDGKMEIVPVRYNTGALISYLVNSIKERASAKDLEFVVNVDPSIPRELFGDDTRINQVISNLLTNAVKYTHKGTVTLTIEALKQKDDKVLLYVEVRDTGIGIKESEIDKMFESFERLDLAKNKNIEGTGLGMSITTRLLKLMDSELKVSSVYGEGSVFSFELWQRIEDRDPLGEFNISAYEEDESVAKDVFRAPSARILVVDDTKMNIMVVTGLLKHTDIKIDTALSGDVSIKLAEENEYDVILMDQRMPGMDGTEAMREIRADKSGKNTDTPVICLTADAIRGARERYIAEGFTDYLTKPVDVRRLERMLLKYIPDEKVMINQTPAGKQQAAETVTNEDLSEALAAAGIDMAAGMDFCQGDEEVYREILAEFADDYETHRKNLENCYGSKDWQNYRIYIHSLKSSSKTIGAAELSEMAARLEKAAKDKDEAVLNGEHDRTMELYEHVASAIKSRDDIAPGDDGT